MVTLGCFATPSQILVQMDIPSLLRTLTVHICPGLVPPLSSALMPVERSPNAHVDIFGSDLPDSMFR